MTFARVEPEVEALPCSTLETVADDTPALRATTWIVTATAGTSSCAMSSLPGLPTPGLPAPEADRRPRSRTLQDRDHMDRVANGPANDPQRQVPRSVSYTHLTMPTNR